MSERDITDNGSTDKENLAETKEKLDSSLESTGEAEAGNGVTDSAEEATPTEETEAVEGAESDGANQQSSDSDSATFIEDMGRGLRDGLLESLGDGDSDSTGSGLGEQFGRLLGEMVIRKLAEQIQGVRGSESEADANDLNPAEVIESEIDGESLSESLGGDFFSDVKDDIEDGWEVIEKTEELLETVDMTELPEAIDMSEIPEVIDTGEIPAAIANADPKRAVKLRKLASLVDFGDLWNAVDVREFMRDKDELEDAVGDVTGDDDADSEDTDDSSLTDSLGSSDSSDSSGSSADSGGAELGGGKAQAMQVAIQSKLRDAVEEFRENVLDAREQVKEARDTAQETVEEKTGGGTGQPSSRNPTAYSTMVSGWNSSSWSSAGFSTVPQETRHSSAPGHFRIYGRRFDKMEDDDE